MKSICFGVLLLVLLTGAVFAETNQKVATDAEILLGQQEDRSAANHLFMDSSVLVSRENRIKLNEYRSKFNAIAARIYLVRNRISTSLNARDTDIAQLSALRQQLEGLIGEHDNLISEFKQWISSIK